MVSTSCHSISLPSSWLLFCWGIKKNIFTGTNILCAWSNWFTLGSRHLFVFYLRTSRRKEYTFQGVSKKYIKVQDLGKKAGNRLENKFSHSTNLRIFESLSCAFSHFISKGMRTMWDIKHWHQKELTDALGELYKNWHYSYSGNKNKVRKWITCYDYGVLWQICSL